MSGAYRLLLLVPVVCGCMTPKARPHTLDLPEPSPSDIVRVSFREPRRLPPIVVAADPSTAGYPVHCPDVLEVSVLHRPDISGRFAITPEGWLPIAALNSPRVEGRTVPEIRGIVSKVAQIPVDLVACRVVDYRSRMVYVFGPVNGPPRPVPWQGPETVIDLLRRIGGLQLGASYRKLYLVRGNITRSGTPPEVFTIDLKAVLRDNDPRTDIVVEPFDEIYVDETRRSEFVKRLPDWLQPVVRLIVGVR